MIDGQTGDLTEHGVERQDTGAMLSLYGSLEEEHSLRVLCIHTLVLQQRVQYGLVSIGVSHQSAQSNTEKKESKKYSSKSSHRFLERERGGYPHTEILPQLNICPQN